MRIASDVLQRYIAAPTGRRELRELLEDVGLEVKRVETDESGDIFTLELLANRGDHHCYEGVARELNGRIDAGVSLPELTELDVGPSAWPLVNETPLCLIYTATLLERGDSGALPADALRKGANQVALYRITDGANVLAPLQSVE